MSNDASARCIYSNGVITMTPSDIIKLSNNLEEVKKYFGWLVKIKYQKNVKMDRGLKRSLTIDPAIEQEFEPEDKYYILAGLAINSTPDNIILNCIHITKSENISIYWKIKLNTAGIVYFNKEPNRFDILSMELHQYITKDIELKLMPKWKRILEEEKTKVWEKYSQYPIMDLLPLEIVEKIISYIPISVPISTIKFDRYGVN